MKYEFFPLWSDICFYLFLFFILIITIKMSNHYTWKRAWYLIKSRRLSLFSLLVLLIFFLITIIDSIHFKISYVKNEEILRFNQQIVSSLDILLYPLSAVYEETYSAPFSLHSYVKSTHMTEDKKIISDYSRLRYSAPKLLTQDQVWLDVKSKIFYASIYAVVIWLVVLLLYMLSEVLNQKIKLNKIFVKFFNDKHYKIIRFTFYLLFILFILASTTYYLSKYYHIFGTDKIGQDVFYQTVKSVRTGILIGLLTCFIMLPFAIVLGVLAGYKGGWVDDLIQYIYTTISSIPGILLVAASILSIQILINKYEGFFQYLTQRADLRMLMLCFVLSITGWTGLCRIIRAETLKLRELEFVSAAICLGISKTKILFKHILPNLHHLIIINLALDFSTLVLAESVLSYIGIGVDSSTYSWGNMINAARFELSREPVVWWPITAAFILMFLLVFSENIFADRIRDAFDPKTKIN